MLIVEAKPSYTGVIHHNWTTYTGLRISVVHPTLNKAGGAERYCIEMINTLTSLGHHVNLYTIDRTDWEKLAETQHLEADPNKEYFLQEKRLDPNGVLAWLRTAILYTWILVKGVEDGETCINNYGEIMPFFAQVSIVHSVPMTSLTGNNYNIPYWKMLQPLYNRVYSILAPYNSDTIITNSHYNAERLKHTGKTWIIYPPVNIPNMGVVEKNGEVLTVARLKASKNLNIVAEIASRTRVGFNIAGSSEYGSERIIRELRDFKNIEIYVNPRRDKILELMSKCSIYLSTQPDEAFGIALVEAMSLGCIPVVYRSGGPWTDILGEQETYGLGYSTNEEAAERIKELLLDEEKRIKLRDNGLKRSREFSTEAFRENLTNFIEQITPHKEKDQRVYRWYRKIYTTKKKMEKRLSTLAPG